MAKDYIEQLIDEARIEAQRVNLERARQRKGKNSDDDEPQDTQDYPHYNDDPER